MMFSLKQLLQNFLSAAGDMPCPLCREASAGPEGLCQECLRLLEEEASLLCIGCGETATTCTCQERSLSPLPVFLGNRTWLAHTWYLPADEDRRTEALLLRCKERYSPALSAYIARIMAADLEKLLPEAERNRWILTWAPRSVSGYTSRGFDQCEEIVRQMGRLLGIPARQMLVRIGGGEQKNMENADRRTSNITDAFAVRKVPEGCRVLLFDDIITTGATMREAGRVLAEAGAAAVFPAAFAKTVHPKNRQKGT